MRRWWAASYSVQEARIKRANFMTRVCSLWKASAVYARPRDDRRHCRRAAADRQSQRRSLHVVGLRDEAASRGRHRVVPKHAADGGIVYVCQTRSAETYVVTEEPGRRRARTPLALLPCWRTAVRT